MKQFLLAFYLESIFNSPYLRFLPLLTFSRLLVFYIYFLKLDWIKYLLILAKSIFGSSYIYYTVPQLSIFYPGLTTIKIFTKNCLSNCLAQVTIPEFEQYNANFKIELSFVTTKVLKLFNWLLRFEDIWKILIGSLLFSIVLFLLFEYSF